MRSVRKYYLPNLCITFTLAIILVTGLNLANDNDPTGFKGFILQFAGVLCIIGFVDFLLERLEYKNWRFKIAAEFIANYVIFIAAAYLLNWFGFRIQNIIYFTIIYILIFAVIILRTDRMMKQDEAWINMMLKKRNSDNQ